jgi:hypothetical protein
MGHQPGPGVGGNSFEIREIAESAKIKAQAAQDRSNKQAGAPVERPSLLVRQEKSTRLPTNCGPRKDFDLLKPAPIP